MPVDIAATDDEDGGPGAAGTQELEEAIFGVSVDIAAIPVCNNTIKGAITDGGKNANDGP